MAGNKVKSIFRRVCIFAAIAAIAAAAVVLPPFKTSAASFFDGQWPQTVIDPNRDFQFGIHVHQQGHANYYGYDKESVETYMRLVAESGATLVRLGGFIETRVSIEAMDHYIAAAEAYGLDIMYYIGWNADYYKPEQFYNHAAFVAQRYKGRIKYYQMFNETSGASGYDGTGIRGYGRFPEDYDPLKAKVATSYMKAVSDALHKYDPGVKRVINIPWLHTGIIKYYAANGVDFEVVGSDWYSNAEYNAQTKEVFNDRPTWNKSFNNYESFWDDMIHSFPDKEIIVCESNDFNNFYYDEDEQQEYFMTFLNMAYNSVPKEKLLGVVYYELLDQPNHGNTQGGTVHNAEAHLGLFNVSFATDTKKSEILGPKPLYLELQQLFGGGPVTPDWSKAKKPIEVNTGEGLGGDPTITDKDDGSSGAPGTESGGDYNPDRGPWEPAPDGETESQDATSGASSQSDGASSQPREVSSRPGGGASAQPEDPGTPAWAVVLIVFGGVLLTGGGILLLQRKFGIFGKKKTS